MEILRHLLLALSVAAVASAALRAASLAAPRGLERVLAAVPLAAAAALLQLLLLGLAGLGTEPLALAGAAMLTWTGTRVWLPSPRAALGAELSRWWSGLGRGARAVAGAMAAGFAGWTGWLAYRPALDTDSLLYHLAQPAIWIQTGTPGSVEPVLYDFPVGNYPLVNELLVTWAMALAGGFGPVMLVQPAFVLLVAAAGAVLLRELGVRRGSLALAVGAVITLPPLVLQLGGVKNDLSALGWLACAAALCACAPRRPVLLAPALVAAGLALGTKTPAAVPALAIVALVVWGMRRPLRPLAPLLWAAGGVAAVVGGTWYLRNLVRHGSPGWPFVTTPWGDPAPPVVEGMTDSLLDRPRRTLEGRLHLYRDALAGGVVLLAAALLAPLAVRRREVVDAALFVLALVLLWASAPVTGTPDPPAHDVSLTTVSYLLPALAVAAVALALAARDRSWRGALAVAALATALIWNVRLSAQIPFERIPPPALLAGVAAAGALIGLLLARLPAPRPLAAGALAAAAAVAVALGATSGSWLERHAEARPYDSSDLVAWLAEDPRYRDGDAPIHFAPDMLAVLAGERLRHPLELIPVDEPCARVVERLQDGWIVIRLRPAERTLVTFTALDCLAGREPAYRSRSFLAFAPQG